MNKKYKLKIRDYRKLKNLSQQQLAWKIGISRSYLADLENNKFDIKLSILLKISDELDVCLGELIEDNRYPKQCIRKNCNLKIFEK